MICSRLLVTLLMKSAPWTLTFCTADAKVAQSKRTARTEPKVCGRQRSNVAERAVRTRDMLIMSNGVLRHEQTSPQISHLVLQQRVWLTTSGSRRRAGLKVLKKRREVAGANGHRSGQHCLVKNDNGIARPSLNTLCASGSRPLPRNRTSLKDPR